MSTLRAYLEGVDDADARSALYYLGRYVKQASYFDEYGKDIFEDEARSAPSEDVKELTRRMIAAVEEREAMLASDFTEAQFMRLIQEITALESELGPEVSDEESKRVQRFMDSFQTPTPKS